MSIPVEPTPSKILWTPHKLNEFKKLYATSQEEVLTFEGQRILKSYAKYLIEYLDTIVWCDCRVCKP